MRDYYDILGVAPHPGADEIKRAHRQLMRRYKPVISGDDPTMAVADCLADEVAIDFPSVHNVLDRMRHAFFGDAPDPQAGPDIEITAKEAFWGATVPLSVPVRRVCADCGGRGEVWGGACRTCDGAGDTASRQNVHLRIPPRVQDGTRIRFRVVAAGVPETSILAHIVIR
jgi:DnaJ-class molecular chaperone